MAAEDLFAESIATNKSLKEAVLAKQATWDKTVGDLNKLATDGVNKVRTEGEKAVAAVKQENQVFDKKLADQIVITQNRYVTDIVIGGSMDKLYPVMWRNLPNSSGVQEVQIVRDYNWMQGITGNFGSTTHIAGLLLAMEVNDTPWGGGYKLLKVKHFTETYHNVASHLAYGGYCFRKPIDPSKPLDYGADGTNYLFSGLYLRGGGLKYRIISSFDIKASLKYLNGSDDNAEMELHRYMNAIFYAKPLPFTELKSPVVSV